MLINAVVCIVFFYNFGLIDAVNKLYECDIHATLIRQIKNDGFHRELHTNVELILGHSTVPWKQCRIILSENLPNSIYVNPNELNDLRRLSQISARLNSSIDIEAPQHKSETLMVMQYSELEHTENLLSSILILPIHARYHSPRQYGGFYTAVIKAPKLLVHCSEQPECMKLKKYVLPCYEDSTDTCTWTEVNYKTNADKLNMPIPVGDSEHYMLVAAVTGLVAAGGCIYILSILASIWQYSK